MFNNREFGLGVEDNPLIKSPYIQDWTFGTSSPPPPSSPLLLLSTGSKFLLSTNDKLELAG